jgi:hypothetical protein
MICMFFLILCIGFIVEFTCGFDICQEQHGMIYLFRVEKFSFNNRFGLFDDVL